MRYAWHLDLDAWKQLAAQIRSLKWIRKPFDESFAYQVPQSPGVYLICARPPMLGSRPHRDFHNVIYAGRSSTSLQQRFLKHLRNPDARLRQALACFSSPYNTVDYFYANLPTQQVALVESLLIDCYGPPGNSQSGDRLTLKARVRYDKATNAG
jgi:hypothetical protein